MNYNCYYVYQYLDESGNPYYVGKGKDRRIDVVHKHTELPPKNRRIKLVENLTNEEAKKFEIELINKFGRKIDGGILDNIKINQWACRSGWMHSTKTKEAISQKNKGKIRSQEAKERYRLSKSEMSDATKEKIRQANLGRKDDGRYAKAAATLKGKPWSDARRNAFLSKKASKEI